MARILEKAGRRFQLGLWSVVVSVFGGPLGCGYHAVYGGAVPERLHVKLARSLIPDAVAADEVVSAAREWLARQGALEAGNGWPCAEIEVLRADEASEGIAVKGGLPAARAADVALVGRAWIVWSEGGDPVEDTGDLRAEQVAAVDESGGQPDPRADAFRHPDALRAAARRLGQKLARKLLGLPVASEEAIDR